MSRVLSLDDKTWPGGHTRHVPLGSQFTMLREGRTRYEFEGRNDAPVVLLVHGTTYPMEVWNELMPVLVISGFRVCRFDLWGRGHSDAGPDKLTVAAHVDQCVQLERDLKLPARLHLVGLSSADLILAARALRDPSSIASVTWIAPTVADPQAMPWWQRSLGALRWLRRLFEPFVRRRNTADVRDHQRLLRPDASVRLRNAFAVSLESMEESPSYPGAVLSHLGNLPTQAETQETFRRFGQLKIPTTAIHFRDELEANKDAMIFLALAVPHAKLVQLPGTHMALLEQPEAVCAEVIKGLSAVESGATS